MPSEPKGNGINKSLSSHLMRVLTVSALLVASSPTFISFFCCLFNVVDGASKCGIVVARLSTSRIVFYLFMDGYLFDVVDDAPKRGIVVARLSRGGLRSILCRWLM
jgi:hypothetical protein